MANVTQTSTKDSALSAHMNQIFSYMSAGVAVSGLVAYLTTSSPALLNIALSSGWIFMIIWLGFGFFMHKIVFSLQPTMALTVFAVFSALTGFTLAPLALVYTGASIATAFFTAAAMFGGAALYGYATKKSLSGWGNFLMMGVWGLLGAMVVNLGFALFTGAPISGLSFITSLIAVPLFAGMTAYETNQLKETFYQVATDEVLRARVAIIGACSLYMNFVIMFTNLLQLMGNRE